MSANKRGLADTPDSLSSNAEPRWFDAIIRSWDALAIQNFTPLEPSRTIYDSCSRRAGQDAKNLQLEKSMPHAPVVESSGHCGVSDAVHRVLFDEGPMSVIVEFLGSCHALGAACHEMKKVLHRVGQFYLTRRKSKDFLEGADARMACQQIPHVAAREFPQRTIRKLSRPAGSFLEGRMRNPATQLRLNLYVVSLGDLAEICKFRHLIYELEVDLSRGLFNAAQLTDVLGCMPKLIKLTIKKTQLLTSVAFIKSFPALHELTLTHLPNLDLRPLAGCPYLRVLKLPDSKISDDNLAKYCRMNPFLQVIHLPRVATRLSFISMRETPRLRELNIQGRTAHSADFTPLFGLPSLETLEVSKTHIKAKVIREIRCLHRLIVHADGTREKRKEIAKLRQVLPHIVIEDIHDEERPQTHYSQFDFDYRGQYD